MTEMAVARVPESSAEERAPTGLPELDGMLEGGFLTGSLITLTGRPGTGKTIFGSHFLYHGAKQAKQSGMYVSMLESEKPYLHNVRRIGLDYGPFMAQKQFAVRALPAPPTERPPGRRRAGPVHGDYEDAWNEPPDGSHPDRHRSSRDSNRPSACPRQARLGCGEAWRRGSWRSDGPCGGSDEPRFGTLMPPSLPGGTLRGRGE